jgi:endonuclease/exonuclease/phosphatase family metal-dependent hydrolase
VLCAFALSLAVAPMTANAATAKVVFLQFNVCGKTCRLGTAVVGDVEGAVTSASPQPYVLTLNEMCGSDYTRLAAGLPAYHGHFATIEPRGCADGTDYGDAILLRTTSFTYLGSWVLPRPSGGEGRRITCLKSSITGASRPLVACVTHIDYRPSNAAAQTAAVASRAGGYAPANAVVVGGDFNNPPPSSALAAMYSASYPGGHGRFVEADSADFSRTGGGAASTYNQFTGCGGVPCPSAAHPMQHKVDYVFLSSEGFTAYAATTRSSAHSDHRSVLANAVVK